MMNSARNSRDYDARCFHNPTFYFRMNSGAKYHARH